MLLKKPGPNKITLALVIDLGSAICGLANGNGQNLFRPFHKTLTQKHSPAILNWGPLERGNGLLLCANTASMTLGILACKAKF